MMIIANKIYYMITFIGFRMRSKSYITPRPSKMIKSTSESNIPVFVGCHSTNPSATTSTPIRSLIPRFVGRTSVTSVPNSVASNAGISSEMISENIGLSEALSEESLDQPEFLESEEAPILETKSESGAS